MLWQLILVDLVATEDQASLQDTSGLILAAESALLGT
jgi:hypothetical protein